MKTVLCLTVALGLLAAACGSEVARETGTIEASLNWSGIWPEEGSVVAALFDAPPWDPAFEPGPPPAFSTIQRPAGATIQFSMASPGIPFGSYGSLVVAWQDPDASVESERMRPVSVYGTSLDALNLAEAVVITEQAPDLVFVLPAAELYASSDEMRLHYPPVDY